MELFCIKPRNAKDCWPPAEARRKVQRSMVLNTVSYVVITKNIKQVRVTFLQGFKKPRSARTQGVSMALASGEGVLSLKEYQHWHPRKEGI